MSLIRWPRIRDRVAPWLPDDGASRVSSSSAASTATASGPRAANAREVSVSDEPGWPQALKKVLAVSAGQQPPPAQRPGLGPDELVCW